MAIKKKFIDVKVPLLDTSLSVLGSSETLQGRTIKLDMTRKLRGKSLEIIFQILLNKELIAVPKKMTLMKFYIRRMIRNNTSYVEDSFKAETKDNIKVTIKPFLITRKRVSRVIRNNLRRTAREFLINYAREKEYLEICAEILTGELQKSLQPKLKKIYPLSFCDIRSFETKEVVKVDLKLEKLANLKKLDNIEEETFESEKILEQEGSEESEEEKSPKKPSKKFKKE